MTSRRDVLRLASALGLAGALPPTADRVAAVQLLDQEVSPNVVLDPAGFADRVDGILAGQLEDAWLCAVNPEQHAAYRRALASLQRAVTVTNTPEGFRAYGDYEGEIFNYIMASYDAGLRHGAAYENLRRSVVGEVTACRACWSVGITKDGSTCSTCGGTGTVALRA